MREKTRGRYKWLISKQSLQEAYDVSQPEPVTPSKQESPPAPPRPGFAESETALAITRQGYTALMSMHHEVTQAYEKMLVEKDRQIVALNQELERTRRRSGFWRWLWGR